MFRESVEWRLFRCIEFRFEILFSLCTCNEVIRNAANPSTWVSIWCHCDGIVLATVHVGYVTAGTVGVAEMYVSILTLCCHIVRCGTRVSYPGHMGCVGTHQTGIDIHWSTWNWEETKVKHNVNILFYMNIILYVMKWNPKWYIKHFSKLNVSSSQTF